MRGAVGAPLSAEPLLAAARRALAEAPGVTATRSHGPRSAMIAQAVRGVHDVGRRMAPAQHLTLLPLTAYLGTARRVKIGERERGQLDRLREQLLQKPREATKAAKDAKPGSPPTPVCS